MSVTYEEINGIQFSDEAEGAVDLDACPTRTSGRNPCRCKPVCVLCGYGEHSAIHGPVYGGKPGGKPWGHKFQAKDD